MIDTTKIRLANDLMAIVTGGALSLKRVAGTGGGEWAGPCPFCGGTDRFRVQPNAPDGGRWLCRTCTDGRWQDVIDYVMRRDSKGFAEACEYLGADRPAPEIHRVSAPAFKFSLKAQPSPHWQTSAKQIVLECEHNLWGPQGERAKVWLHERGLRDETLKQWHIGFNPGRPGEKRELHTLSVPCGVIIPGFMNDALWYIKVRRADGEPRYTQVKGSRPVLYLSETLVGREAAILTEGEFDALLLWQEAGDKVGVATLGSAVARVDMASWGKQLQAVKHLLVAYDSDDAGRAAMKSISEALPQAKAVIVPTLQAGHKDITDYACAGGSLRDWVPYLFRRYHIPLS